MTRLTPLTPQRRRRVHAAVVSALAAVLAVALVTISSPAAQAKKVPTPPVKLFADKASVHAPHKGPLATYRKVPQARWFTGLLPVTKVRAGVKSYVLSARRSKARPVLVIYAIPQRDCGHHSAGGHPDAQSYRAWVTQIAKGLKPYRSSAPIVILEPDSIAAVDNCGGAERYQLLRWATKKLSGVGAWVYLDGGHSNWIPEAEMAERLLQAGVGSARGISLNVSNFQSTAAERAYGTSVVLRLNAAGVRGKRFVIDTSRNGAAPRDAEWCNPFWAKLGVKPKLFKNKAPLEGFLWVKHPGESDGYCNGGPAAGMWSPHLATQLQG